MSDLRVEGRRSHGAGSIECIAVLEFIICLHRADRVSCPEQQQG